MKNFSIIMKLFSLNWFGEISPSKKSNFNETFAIDNVRTKYSLNKNFTYCDKKTNLHGRHISENKGVPNFHLSVLKKSEQEKIKKIFHEFMITFNYT